MRTLVKIYIITKKPLPIETTCGQVSNVQKICCGGDNLFPCLVSKNPKVQMSKLRISSEHTAAPLQPARRRLRNLFSDDTAKCSTDPIQTLFGPIDKYRKR